MHQLWQHDNGRYYVLYGPRLKRRISTGSTDRRTAEAFLAKFIAGSKAPVVDQPTVGEILEGYYEDSKARVRSPATLFYSVKALTPHFGPYLSTQLLPTVVREYVKVRGVAPGTMLREVGVLRASLTWAKEHQWIAEVPPISNPVRTPRPRDRWLTREEAQKLLAECKDPHIKAFVMLGLMTAARTSAILELLWSQIDFAAGTVNFGAGHGNKRRAIVPINDELKTFLLALKEMACSEFVIEYHGRPVTRIVKGIRAACDRAGLVGVSAHILRHTAATWMAMAGVPLSEIARLLGDTETTVEKTYAKHTPGYLRRAANALQLGPTVAT